MKMNRDIVELVSMELEKVERTPHEEITGIECSHRVISALEGTDDFVLAEEVEWSEGGLRGYYKGYPCLLEYDFVRGKFEVTTEELYEACEECKHPKMYDEMCDKHYCPRCDENNSFRERLITVPLQRVSKRVRRSLRRRR